MTQESVMLISVKTTRWAMSQYQYQVYSQRNCCQHIGPVLFKQKVTYLWPNDELPAKKNRVFETCCDFLCVSVYLTGAPKHCQINTITLTNTPMMGPVLLLEEYGSFLQIISHTLLTFSEPPVSSGTRRNGWQAAVSMSICGKLPLM